jgi:hypothetical protein
MVPIGRRDVAIAVAPPPVELHAGSRSGPTSQRLSSLPEGVDDALGETDGVLVHDRFAFQCPLSIRIVVPYEPYGPSASENLTVRTG